MCFAPQRRALFSTSEPRKVIRTPSALNICLRNVLCATTACAFSTSEPPKVFRTPSVLNILTWKCLSRHNGVHFFDISSAKSGPHPWRFVYFDFEMCFAPQRRTIFHLSSGQLAPHPPLERAYFSTLRSPKSLGKQWFATFLPFHVSASSFFLLFFLLIFLFSLPLPCSAFHLFILSEIWLLNFLRSRILKLNYKGSLSIVKKNPVIWEPPVEFLRTCHSWQEGWFVEARHI